ncbi:hypothetical protein CNMCM8927_001604 [Aspergillus lentulus]|uniref:Uncharacterized protein n=1 Tax=Aspergillus lentulus TaxID=293939 RepID=A0AAN5YIS3_ASPLE|nr:hypothetical protein CNMCM8060_002076 [Aspergillus lentulus]KAF4178918.1 hypothetical protein CNMCM7927_002206 [Aspergillus lentulus]KAF4191877.1 hypothetical protein CNMCM8694_001152 [Aspergillus lentulus]KAF4201423.1 hypothetical protein CNMCM8927_001604 [Aspergillus lentulus]GFF56124.1 hypothetical protein IFM62136_03033 [Aspergillus lentulus]
MTSPPIQYSELQQTGTTFPLELELEEDIEEEIHHFVKLSRLGDYAEAQRFFDQTLRKHDHLFPVVAEYADMLLEQGRCRHASEVLEKYILSRSEILNGDEMQLLKIMKSLADMHSKGALRSALVEAEEAWQFIQLASRESSGKILNEVHILEMYVNIVVFGFLTCPWVDETWMCCPLLRPTAQTDNGFVRWFCILRQEGLLLEASRVLRALLPVMPSLSAGDLGELLDDSWIAVSRSQGLSFPDLWASLMVTLHQSRFFLNAAILAETMGQDNRAAKVIYGMGRTRLESAQQQWDMLQLDQDPMPLNLQLSLEKIIFAFTGAALFAQPTGYNTTFALSNLLFEADRRHDLRSQVLTRLYILLSDFEARIDWRDLHSILELLEVDCGNAVEHMQIWSLLANWVPDSRVSVRYAPMNLPFESHPFTLLLSLQPFETFSDQELAQLLHARYRPLLSDYELRESFDNIWKTHQLGHYDPLRHAIPYLSTQLHSTDEELPRSFEINELIKNLDAINIQHHRKSEFLLNSFSELIGPEAQIPEALSRGSQILDSEPPKQRNTERLLSYLAFDSEEPKPQPTTRLEPAHDDEPGYAWRREIMPSIGFSEEQPFKKASAIPAIGIKKAQTSAADGRRHLALADSKPTIHFIKAICQTEKSPRLRAIVDYRLNANIISRSCRKILSKFPLRSSPLQPERQIADSNGNLHTVTAQVYLEVSKSDAADTWQDWFFVSSEDRLEPSASYDVILGRRWEDKFEDKESSGYRAAPTNIRDHAKDKGTRQEEERNRREMIARRQQGDEEMRTEQQRNARPVEKIMKRLSDY